MLTRFAPSPTGYLHVGNARTALISWLYARKNQGKFILRFDDTDITRTKNEYIEDIYNSLKWLNINWDDSFHQSSRFQRYNEVFDYLLEKSFIYPCYESKDELDFKRKMQLKNKLPPIYDRYSLQITEKQKAIYTAEGRLPYFRFKITNNAIISWNDIRTTLTFNMKNISDPIIRRADKTYTYMLPSVIDDLDYGITHIIRGEDHITNTAIQIDILNALKGKIPTFFHLSLLYMNDSKISKRVGGYDIKSLQLEDLEYMSLNNYLAKIGTSDPISTYAEMNSLIDSFEINKFNQAPTQFNMNDVWKLNAKVLSNMNFSHVEQRLLNLGVSSEKFWHSVKSNIKKLSDIKNWWDICNGNITPIIKIQDKNYIELCLSLLPQGNWNENTWNEWINNIKQNTDRKAQELFQPLRMALTGTHSGPELAPLLPMIGKDKVINRLTSVL